MVSFLVAQPQVDVKATTNDGCNALHYLGHSLCIHAQQQQASPLSVPAEIKLRQLLVRLGVDDQLRNDKG